MNSSNTASGSRLCSKHEELRAILEALATLSGYSRDLGGCFPDGSRPDVIRIDPLCGSVFVGDAKDTESPGCSASYSRLATYLRWLLRLKRGLKHSMLAICANTSARSGWETTLYRLAHENGLAHFSVRVAELDDFTVVTWLDVRAYEGGEQEHGYRRKTKGLVS